MSNNIKTQQEILDKLNISSLNPMQEEALSVISTTKEVVLLSPTGTGKTLAFLLPLLDKLDIDNTEIQAVIVVPSRELAIQIEQVFRNMGTGFKINAVYGGRSGSKDRIEISHRPAVLVGTPGRLADHLRREAFSVKAIETIILDEFDKSLEIGFDEEMIEILDLLTQVKFKILTSATNESEIPRFVDLKSPKIIDYSQNKGSKLEVKTIISSSKDKLETLVDALNLLGTDRGIVFCNFKDSIERISDYLNENNITHGCFYGGMEQKDRERALIKFRNGTHKILLATDLAARGIDVPEIKFIIHYHLPNRIEEFTHRNGRTARMNADGAAYILKYKEEHLPDYISRTENLSLKSNKGMLESPKYVTLFVSGGRKDKISKGDLAGLFCKQGNLSNDELGAIELKQDCAFVAVDKKRAFEVIELVNNTKLKKKKVRVTLI